MRGICCEKWEKCKVFHLSRKTQYFVWNTMGSTTSFMVPVLLVGCFSFAFLCIIFSSPLFFNFGVYFPCFSGCNFVCIFVPFDNQGALCTWDLRKADHCVQGCWFHAHWSLKWDTSWEILRIKLTFYMYLFVHVSCRLCSAYLKASKLCLRNPCHFKSGITFLLTLQLGMSDVLR